MLVKRDVVTTDLRFLVENYYHLYQDLKNAGKYNMWHHAGPRLHKVPKEMKALAQVSYNYCYRHSTLGSQSRRKTIKYHSTMIFKKIYRYSEHKHFMRMNKLKH